MDGIEPSLLPYDEDERTAMGGYRRGQRKRDPRTFGARVRGALQGLRGRLKGLRSAARRAAFEAGATMRSSAALAGLSRDARKLNAEAHSAGAKLRTSVKEHTPRSAAFAGLGDDVRRVRRDLERAGGVLMERIDEGANRAAARLDRGGKRLKRTFLRSAFVSGLAIDSRRVAKRVRHPRRGHGPGSAH